MQWCVEKCIQSRIPLALKRDSLSTIRRNRTINDLSREDHFDRSLIQIVHERPSSLRLFAENFDCIRFREIGAFEFG